MHTINNIPFNRQKLHISLSLSLLTVPVLSNAQTLEEVFVTGQYIEETLPQQLADSGHHLEMITADTLELGAYLDMSQTLQMEVPGLYIAPKSGAFDYMNCSLQGSRCADILWLVDGVRINNRLYANTSPLDTIPAHMVERVEVLYGGQGIFYGTQAVAGVVNIVTKPYSQSTRGSVSVGGHSNDGTSMNGDIGFAFGRNQVVLYGSKDKADGFKAIRDEERQPSQTHVDRGYDVETLGIKYAVDISDRNRLSLHYHHTDAYLENMRAYRNAIAFNERDEDLITLKWDYAVNDSAAFFLKGYYHTWDTVWSRIENVLDSNGNVTGALNPVFVDTYWGYEDKGINLGARIETDLGLTYTVGYDHQRYSASDEVWLIENKTEAVNAIFAQVSTSDRLFEDTTLALGLRYNRLGGTNDTIWNFSGQHQVTDTVFLRGSVGTTFRLPDAEELYLKDCCEVGNPDLEPEESLNVNLGIGGHQALTSNSVWNWQVDAFHRTIDNLIEVDSNQPGYPDGIFMNMDDQVTAKGFQITTSLNFNSGVNLNLDYTHTDAQADSSSEQLQDIPEDTLKAAVTYQPDILPMELRLSLLQVGKVYDDVSRVGRRKHGNYTVADISGAWYRGIERQHRIGFRLENAFDKAYSTQLNRGLRDVDDSPYAYGFAGTPRTLHVTYTYNF